MRRLVTGRLRMASLLLGLLPSVFAIGPAIGLAAPTVTTPEAATTSPTTHQVVQADVEKAAERVAEKVEGKELNFFLKVKNAFHQNVRLPLAHIHLGNMGRQNFRN